MQTDIDQLEIYLPSVKPDALTKLRRYYEILLAFNATLNLVSKSTAAFAGKQHFADSVYGLEICWGHSELQGDVYDFGSGNGFPGLVLAILRPDLKVFLVDRDVRKSEFMKHVAGDLKLTNVTVLTRPYESLPKASVQTAITRALGSLPTLLIQMSSLFDEGARFFHFKSDTWTTELANCPTQVFSHWDIQSAGGYVLPDSTIKRNIVLAKKIK